MIGANIAPGLKRTFLSESWEHLIPALEWKLVRQEAEDMVDTSVKMDIQAFDIRWGYCERQQGKMQGVLGWRSIFIFSKDPSVL